MRAEQGRSVPSPDLDNALHLNPMFVVRDSFVGSVLDDFVPQFVFGQDIISSYGMRKARAEA